MTARRCAPLRQAMPRIHRELIGYTLASACALVADVGLLATLVQLAGMHYLLAASISFCVGTLVSYLLCTRFVFAYRRVQVRELEFAMFLAIGAIGLAVNASAMFVSVQFLGLHYLLAKLSAAGVTFFTNYIARRLLLFTPRTATAE